jgi:hypothetical protein
MLTIISAVIGFIGGLAPEVIKFFNAKGDRKHELDIMDRQIEMQKQGAMQRLEEINVQSDVAESIALYKSAETKITGYKWLDGLIEAYNSGVRPSITYAVLLFYGLHKFEITTREFTEFDQSTLMLVLGYWFGQRAAIKIFGRK